MSPDKHLFSGAVTGTVLLLTTSDEQLSIGALLGNVVCDTDHIIEYTKFCIDNKRRPSFHEFMSGEYFAEKKKICLIFHGWEYLLLLILIAKAGKNHGVMGFTLGYAIHLILDTLGNDCTAKGYSIIYRKKAEWDIDRICIKAKK